MYGSVVADDDDCDLLFGMFGVDDLDDEKENQPLQRSVPQRSSQKSRDHSKSEGEKDLYANEVFVCPVLQ